jgi:hypothetical protein
MQPMKKFAVSSHVPAIEQRYRELNVLWVELFTFRECPGCWPQL